MSGAASTAIGGAGPSTAAASPGAGPAATAAPVVAGGGSGGAPGGAGGASNSPVPAGDWTSGLGDDLKGYVQNKGFKDTASVLNSYMNMEKLMGVPAERLLKLPATAEDPAWGDIHEKLGRPKDAKEYQLDIPKGQEKFGEWAKNTFHELGITKSAGEKLTAKWNEFNKSSGEESAAAYNAKVDAETGALKSEWGMAFEKHMSIAKNAAQQFKMDGAVIDKLEASMGYTGVMKFLHDIGSKLGEGNFVGAGSGGGSDFSGVLSPTQAIAKIQALRRDSDFVRRYTAGDAKATDEFHKLHQMAYPDEASA